MSGKFDIEVKGFGLTEVYENETFESLYKRTVKQKGFLPVCVKVGGYVFELTKKIGKSKKVEFVDLTDSDGMRVYAASASMLTVKAALDVLGEKGKVVIEHTINGNFYCEFVDGSVETTTALLEEIKERMESLVESDLPFEKQYIPKEDAENLSLENGLEEQARILKYVKYTTVCRYNLDGYYDYFYTCMVPSTGYIRMFDLVRYGNGFLLQLPSIKDTAKLESYENLEKISDVFLERLRWCKLMHVNFMADLNDIISSGDFGELIRINEALHEKKIASIADDIAEKKDKLKLVLIAGPSSSGKTTFAQRLCVQLRVNGITPHVIGMDDYFVNREHTPLDEDGKPDYENINALDLELFNRHINALIKGDKVEIPSYNFITGEKEYKGNFMQLKEGDIIVCEGIHGLNDQLTKEIPDENKFKIFISAMTQLNIDSHSRVSTTDCRFIRRMVRDYNFRGNSAATTIESWPSVRRGEEKNIFPYQQNADVMFNSATIYELCVLKTYAEPLLYGINSSQDEYVTAARLLKLLDYLLAASCENVPKNSIIREFIGGSVFKV